jgi:hypothetical protein
VSPPGGAHLRPQSRHPDGARQCEGQDDAAERRENSSEPLGPTCPAPMLAPIGPDGQELGDEQTDEEELVNYRPAAEAEEEAADTAAEAEEEAAAPRSTAEAEEEAADKAAEAEEEAAVPRIPRDPGQPTTKEIDEHAATHLPFRSWCSECVRGRKKNPAHYKQLPSEEGAVPSVHLDYCFLRDGDEELLTVVVVRDKTTKVVFAAAVERKGSSDKDAIEQAAAFVKRLGHPKLIIKSDQEHSVRDFSRAVGARLNCQVMEELSPVDESQSNGVAERAVQQVEDQLRVLKLALERRLDAKLPCAHPVMKWLVPHSADVVTKYLRGHDGKTAFERLLGKPCREDAVEFGECILYKTNRGDEGKLAPRWEPAVWLGKRWGTTEHAVAKADGTVCYCRAVQRLPVAKRWAKDRVEAVRGTPRDPQPADEMPGAPLVLRPRPTADAAGDEAVMARAMQETVPRGFRITAADLERWGYTAGCPRCASTMRNPRAAAGWHSAACRARLEEEMKQANDPRPQRMIDRQNDYCARALEAQDAAAAQAAAEEAIPVAAAAQEEQEGEPMDVDAQPVEETDNEQMLGHLLESTAAARHNADMAAMTGVLLQLGLSKYETHHVVTEIYSPPRVAAAAEKHASLNVKAGVSYDLLTCASDGLPWDFSKGGARARCRREIAQQKPMLVVGSPPCTPFSAWNVNMNYPKMDSEDVRRRRAEGMVHLAFSAEIYATQVRGGRYFLHEHPATADSWAQDPMNKVLGMKGVDTVVGDMCSFGMTSVNNEGEEHPVLKPTRWASNSPQILKRMAVRCTNRGARSTDRHQHTELSGKTRTSAAAIYPPRLCLEILRGFRDQLKADGVDIEAAVIAAMGEKEERHNEWLYDGTFYDDMSGDYLPKELVVAARRLEMDFFWQKNVYDKVPIAEAWDRTGKAPIPVKWVDTNKGDSQNPEVRSRLVAKEFNRYKDNELYAATPPLEALRLLISEAATIRRGAGRRKLLFVDARRAYFNADATRLTYVDLPPEDAEPGMCGRLNKCMYGTRDAAKRWERTYTDDLVNLGFKQGRASPCCFVHQTRQVKCVVHGDDFTFLGTDSDLDWIQNAIAGKFEIKVRGRLGDGSGDVQEMRILNRIVKWGPAGITYEADQRHAEIIVQQFGLTEANCTVSPGEKDRRPEETSPPLDAASASLYRSITARVNYLAQDRPDLAYACKEACRDMCSPTQKSWTRLKHVARYLVGRPRLLYEYRFQDHSDIDAYVDSDFAGDFASRKSTSGGCIMRGTHLIKHWSNNQTVIALSSGEAELYGIVTGASHLIGLQSIAGDLDIEVEKSIHTDASAAKGVCERKGVGKIRHLAVSDLWIQDKVRSGEVRLHKVAGAINPADMLTKHVEGHKIRVHLTTMCTRPAEGRADSAPTVGGGQPQH